MAYVYAIRGYLEFVLTLHAAQVPDIFYIKLMALRETTEDLTEFTPGRCRYD